MALKDLISNALLFRRLIKAQESQATSLEQVATYMRRVADKLAPESTEATEDELKKTGADFSRDREQVQIQIFQQKFFLSHGRWPTDQEVVDELDQPSSNILTSDRG